MRVSIILRALLVAVYSVSAAAQIAAPPLAGESIVDAVSSELVVDVQHPGCATPPCSDVHTWRASSRLARTVRATESGGVIVSYSSFKTSQSHDAAPAQDAASSLQSSYTVSRDAGGQYTAVANDPSQTATVDREKAASDVASIAAWKKLTDVVTAKAQGGSDPVTVDSALVCEAFGVPQGCSGQLSLRQGATAGGIVEFAVSKLPGVLAGDRFRAATFKGVLGMGATVPVLRLTIDVEQREPIPPAFGSRTEGVARTSGHVSRERSVE